MVEMVEIETEKRLRFGIIKSGLLRAHKRLETDTNIKEGDEGFNRKVYEVSSSICELLFWVIANDEWHCNNNSGSYLSGRDRKQDGAGELLGLRHAYNASKHNMGYVSLFSFEEMKDFIKGSGMKISDPSTPAVWINCPDDAKYGGQVKNYRTYIKGKNVLTTFEDAITFLNKANCQVSFG